MTQTDILLGIVLIPVVVDYLNLVFDFLPDGDEPKKISGPVVFSMPTLSSMYGDPTPFDIDGKGEVKKATTQKPTPPKPSTPSGDFTGKVIHWEKGGGTIEWD